MCMLVELWSMLCPSVCLWVTLESVFLFIFLLECCSAVWWDSELTYTFRPKCQCCIPSISSYVQTAGKSDVLLKSKYYLYYKIRILCPDIPNLSAWVTVVTTYGSVITYTCNHKKYTVDPSISPPITHQITEQTIYLSLTVSVLSVTLLF